MKIVVSSFYYPNYAEFAKNTVHGNHKTYCQKHGYIQAAYEVDQSISEDGYKALCEAGKMNAIKVLRALWENRDCNYLFVIGCDAIITKMDVKIEDMAEYFKDYDIVTGSDKAGISTSQMLIKNCKRSLDYFFDILTYIGKGGEHDQRYFWDNPKDFIAKAPYRWLNAYDCEARLEPKDDPTNWQQGDFLVHLAGMTLAQREAVLPKWLGRVN